MAYNPVASQFLDMLQSGQLNGSFQGGPQNQMQNPGSPYGGRRQRTMAPDMYMGAVMTPEQKMSLREQFRNGNMPYVPPPHVVGGGGGTPPTGPPAPPGGWPTPPTAPPAPTPGGGMTYPAPSEGFVNSMFQSGNTPGPTSGANQPTGGGTYYSGTYYVDANGQQWIRNSESDPWTMYSAPTFADYWGSGL